MSTITLFTGWIGTIAGYLALIGAATVLSGIEGFLRRRFTLDLNPKVVFAWEHRGRICIDVSLCVFRRFRVHRRWDRTGAIVVMDDGREATVLLIADSDDEPAAGAMALVQPYDEGDEYDESRPAPVWIDRDRLSRRKPEHGVAA